MVRLKTRYVLFEVVYPEAPQGGATTVLSLHSPTADSVTPKMITQLIRLSLSKNFGELGTSFSLSTFSLKYFSNKTSTGILRVHRDAIKYIQAAFFFITALDGKPCIFNCVGVSGSIKKCEDRSITRSKKLVRLVKAKDGHTDTLDQLFASNLVEIDATNGDEE